MSETRKILLPVDGSDHSKRAFSWYMDHLKRPNDELILFHVCEVPTIAGSPYPFGAVTLYEDWQKTWIQNHDQANNILDDYAKQCQDSKLACKKVMHSGNPGESICEKAKAENASCIVMGSRGLGTIRRTILGSVSHFVLHHTNSATVSIVPPQE